LVTQPGENHEQKARNARIRLFSEWRMSLKLDAVAVGHTQTDQAETICMRLLRGCGPAGLAGIQPVTEDARIRPLIGVDRTRVRNWLAERGFPWREDSSNQSPERLRNRVRGEILPMLARENPRIEEGLARLAGLAGEEEAAWRAITSELLKRVSRWDNGALLLDSRSLDHLEPAAAQRVLRHAANLVRGSLTRLDHIHIEEFARLLRQRTSGEAQAPGLRLRRSFDEIRIERAQAKIDAGPREVRMDGPGRYMAEWAIGPVELLGPEAPADEGFQVPSPGCRYNGGRQILDGDLAAFPLVLRGWRHGDRYQPNGARREYLLHELFQRERIPRWDRERWPVIVSGARIVWARRFGVAEWAAAAPGRLNLIEVREFSPGESNLVRKASE
jgi:tRNA(Ile)-lysidine synthase